MYQDEDKRTIYTFKTSISVGEWRKNQERLETALDCTILQINNKGSKKIVEIISLSSDYKLPTLVEWEDSRAPEGESRMAVGECVMGQVSFDLNKTPHVLVAGETGSGKSVILHVLLWQMILMPVERDNLANVDNSPLIFSYISRSFLGTPVVSIISAISSQNTPILHRRLSVFSLYSAIFFARYCRKS